MRPLGPRGGLPRCFSTGWPLIGTTLLVFPLESVDHRYHILLEIPSYLNHLSR
jgi:hypothetical protein